ncbi:apbE family lipoprotein [Peptostreptococcus anaerobius CAG:621]|uniref:FAD:protein FMN transferase n=1 Tax=Peptostreptococcus anaerobius TaxID=1261 RepID=UPI00033C03F8|nr:FAD:protein FMN transferase [Peptostreptococcus anaerobius]CCY48110.1 apbE family lipoprotein [Peptostreptococcus anaerobius CAG:621]
MKKISLLKIIATIVIVGLIGMVSYNMFDKKDTYSTANYYLDTVNNISVLNTRKSKADKLLPKVDKLILDIHNKMSSQMNSSEISAINMAAGIRPVKVSSDTFNVIKIAEGYSKITDHKFDVSIGPLTSLWNIGNDKARVPSEDEIKPLLGLVNYKDIVLNEKESTVFLKKSGMKLDVGGIAKGYCADKVADLLKSNGIKDAIINLGGNVYVFGHNSQGKNFSVGIQNPTTPEQKSMGIVVLTDKSVVTSGVYERYIEKDGKIYHHMLDPETGYPFDNNLQAVTIISEKSIDADALSTSTFGLGIEKGRKFIDSIDGVDAIFITKDRKVYTTKNIKNKLEITDDSFKLAD